jgi:23S rRNA pseudouridine1911/1915/1917 synthase
MPETRCLHVTADQIAQRLDRFLDASLPELTRSQIKRLIEEGRVTLNGESCKAGSRLRGGEAVTITLPEPVASTAQPEAIPLTILYEDTALIVLDKPAGLVVHPAPGHAGGTLVNALLHHCTDLSGVGGELRPGIVHRLDKDTSGVLVATKDDLSHRQLAAQFKAHTVRRRYRALLYGLVEDDRGCVDQPVGRHPLQRKKMAIVSRGGRRAVTRWRVLRRFEREHMSLVDLQLETGRTHQIRVHMSALQHPVVGDPLYAGNRLRTVADERLRALIDRLGRQFLHAWELGFEHPDGTRRIFRAPLPPELQGLLDYLTAKYNDTADDLAIRPSIERAGE